MQSFHCGRNLVRLDEIYLPSTLQVTRTEADAANVSEILVIFPFFLKTKNSAPHLVKGQHLDASKSLTLLQDNFPTKRNAFASASFSASSTALSPSSYLAHERCPRTPKTTQAPHPLPLMSFIAQKSAMQNSPQVDLSCSSRNFLRQRFQTSLCPQPSNEPSTSVGGSEHPTAALGRLGSQMALQDLTHPKHVQGLPKTTCPSTNATSSLACPFQLLWWAWTQQDASARVAPVLLILESLCKF